MISLTGFDRATRTPRAPPRWSASAVVLALACLGPNIAHADEGGVSFWLPGLESSLAAVPTTPGWSWANVYIRPQVSAGKNQKFANGGQIDLGLDGTGNLVAFGPTYTLPQPVLGGRLGLSLLGIAGQNVASASAILAGRTGRASRARGRTPRPVSATSC